MCKTENDFNTLCHELKVHLVQSDQSPSQSLITICDDRPSDWTLDTSENLSTSSENVAVSLSGRLYPQNSLCFIEYCKLLKPLHNQLKNNHEIFCMYTFYIFKYFQTMKC